MFDIREDLLESDFIVERVDEVDDQIIVGFQQVRDEVYLNQGDYVVTFDADGDLAAASGQLRDGRTDTRFMRSPDSVLHQTAAVLGVDCGDDQFEAPVGSRRDLARANIPLNIEYLTQRESDGDICYVSKTLITSAGLSKAWTVVLPGLTAEVADDSGEVLSVFDGRLEYVTDVCRVRRLEIPRDTSNYATTVHTRN